MRLHIAGQANLKRDARCVDLIAQRLIFEESRRVADARGAALMYRLPDRLRAVALARMTGTGEPVGARVRERLGMQRGWMPGLATGEIEADDASIPKLDRQPGEVEGGGGRQVTQRTDEDASHDVMLAFGACSVDVRRALRERGASPRPTFVSRVRGRGRRWSSLRR